MSTTTTSPKQELTYFQNQPAARRQYAGLWSDPRIDYHLDLLLHHDRWSLSLTAKLFQPFPADDDHRNTLCRHGAGHSGHPHRPVGGQAGRVCIRRGGLFSSIYH